MQTPSPLEQVRRVQANLVYIRGLTAQRRVPKEAIRKVLSDTEALLNDISRQLHARRLT